MSGRSLNLAFILSPSEKTALAENAYYAEGPKSHPPPSLGVGNSYTFGMSVAIFLNLEFVNL